MTWAAMGRCYVSLNDLQQAEECFAMCARENPVDFDSRLRLAEILELTNRKEEALEIVVAGTPPKKTWAN
jgi:thioredoxin-like negative regulator of GroEL